MTKLVVGICGKGNLGVRCLCGSMCTEIIGCGRRWATWVLQGGRTASWCTFFLKGFSDGNHDIESDAARFEGL